MRNFSKSCIAGVVLALTFSAQAETPLLQLVGMSQFGEDANNNAIPDWLDTFAAGIKVKPETKEAESAYSAVISSVSAVARSGKPLLVKHQAQVFMTLSCYALTADFESKAEGGPRLINEAEMMALVKSGGDTKDGKFQFVSALALSSMGHEVNRFEICDISKIAQAKN